VAVARVSPAAALGERCGRADPLSSLGLTKTVVGEQVIPDLYSIDKAIEISRIRRILDTIMRTHNIVATHNNNHSYVRMNAQHHYS
jgi:hypothetical protein